jgi:hypothetical protein
MIISAAAGLVIAVLYGFAWGFINLFMSFFLLNLLMGAGAGYLISEGMSLVINRKRGIKLAVAAGVMVVASYLVSVFPPWETARSSSAMFYVNSRRSYRRLCSRYPFALKVSFNF